MILIVGQQGMSREELFALALAQGKTVERLTSRLAGPMLAYLNLVEDSACRAVRVADGRVLLPGNARQVLLTLPAEQVVDYRGPFCKSQVAENADDGWRHASKQRPMSPSPEDCEDPFAFGAALKRLRLRYKLSLRKLAKSIPAQYAVRHSTLENWGKGTAISPLSEPAFLFVLRTLGVTEQVDLDAWLEAARELRSRPRLTIAEPYRGLKSYDDEYAEVFFGRDALVTRVLDELDQLRTAGGAMLLTGVSGAGKSSLLNAGVLPGLKAGRLEGSARWPVVRVNFESDEPDPLQELARSIAEILKTPAAKVLDDLRDGPEAVDALMKRIVAASTAAALG